MKTKAEKNFYWSVFIPIAAYSTFLLLDATRKIFSPGSAKTTNFALGGKQL